MPLQYNPKDASKTWDKADYEAVLINVEDKGTSSKGDPMELWTVEAYHPDGRRQVIKDYVTVPGATFKIKQLADALGKGSEFAAGTFQAGDNVGASLIVNLTVEEGKDGYEDKNKVARYKAARAGSGSPAAEPKTAMQSARERIQNRPAPAEPFGAPTFKKEEIPF
jgi:hypothetical protein